MTSFNDAIGDWSERLNLIRRIPFEFKIPEGKIPLMRKIERFPYVPANRAGRDERCYEVYNIQVHGLIKRLDSAGIKNVVIGVCQSHGSAGAAQRKRTGVYDARVCYQQYDKSKCQ